MGGMAWWMELLVLACALGLPSLATDEPEQLHNVGSERSRRVERLAPRMWEATYDVVSGTDIQPEVQLRGQFGNNYKPEFPNCSNYHPQIPEEQPVGSFVLQVVAIDEDAPNPGGKLSYSMAIAPDHEKPEFSIDPKTGVVRTAKVFDRDEPHWEKQKWVTVRAIDDGQQRLESVCTFQVKINDINDNHPIFDRTLYVESVPQDTPVNQLVMRISATDYDEGNNGTVQYSLVATSKSPDAMQYFAVNKVTGEITLVKLIDQPPGFSFYLDGVATDEGQPPLSSNVSVVFHVTERNKKPPEFTNSPPDPLRIPENFSDFSAVLLSLSAVSNAKNSSIVFFSLDVGLTLQTNKDSAFTMESEEDTALLKLGHFLDYERVPDYSLTVRAVNTYDLGTDKQVHVALEDVNDNIPRFTDVSPGSVLEEEPPHTFVMRVHAVDDDGTYPNNKVTYSLDSEEQNFAVDETTGDVTTLRKFDLENGDVAFKLVVVATDGAPSSLRTDGKPNERRQDFRIVILDKNDNAPKFTKNVYHASVYENADNNTKVLEVVAKDPDHASTVSYYIIDGNVGNAFWIESTYSRGIIYAYSGLDYEKIKNYTLTIVASDTSHEASAKVEIEVINMNDLPPVINVTSTNVTIEENSIPNYCIFQLSAHDPDLDDSTGIAQNITFFVMKENTSFSVDNKGCVRVTQPLDRDPPHGSPGVQVIVGAWDEWNNQNSPVAYIDLWVELKDVNDNAPFLDMHQPFVWYENQEPGLMTQLQAEDYDSQEAGNAAPYKYALATDTPGGEAVSSFFKVESKGPLFALVTFDREKQKQYKIPIRIWDAGHPPQSAVSILRVVIGDRDDNPMYPGNSSILAYAYKGHLPRKTPLGRVYVEDEDDWDLPNKQFYWALSPEPNFNLDQDTGMISSRDSTRAGEFQLKFKVTDTSRHEEVEANVRVTVRDVSEEAVIKSGSIRFRGVQPDQFVETDPSTGISKREMLGDIVAAVVGAKPENVDVFTVLSPKPIDNSTNNTIVAETEESEQLVDVRFSAHGSPVYPAERLDGLLEMHRVELDQLGIMVEAIHVDACILDKPCVDGCVSYLQIDPDPVSVMTNRSSFVGVSAQAQAYCACTPTFSPKPDPCQPNPCLNGFPCRASIHGGEAQCECGEGFEGPRCEQLSLSLDGDKSWAWFPAPPSFCANGSLSLSFTTHTSSGLLLFWGPISFAGSTQHSDFISLDLIDRALRLFLQVGTGAAQEVQLAIDPNNPLADGQQHSVVARWQPGSLSLELEPCASKMHDACKALVSWTLSGDPRWMLQPDGPLQVGGFAVVLSTLRGQMGWSKVPTDASWNGCISNLTWNANGTVTKVYNLGAPGYAHGATSGCQLAPSPEAATLAVTSGFVVALLVCLALLLLLVLALVVYRRRRLDERTKDGADDVRETIMDYADEGYGEGDHCGFDLSVLRLAPDGRLALSPYPMQGKEPLQGKEPDNRGTSPDIDAFLQESKDRADDDPDGRPCDDVRHYAYEGDGASTGSLSSLASGTDDADLDFDYLSLFGPRFKKLADMYGEHSSDEDDAEEDDGAGGVGQQQGAGPPGSESWC